MPTLAEELNTLSKYGNIKKDIPDFVVENLSHDLREYQEEALARLSFYINEFEGKKKPAQLLYEMATGSGKTLVMAGAMLWLYKQGYRNFIFFVNSTNIIDKTRENFLNPQSSKYLFDNEIIIDAKRVNICEVDNFDEAHPDDINIVFTTIQGLHTRLNQPKENALTYEDFKEKKIVLISDEAHHINTLTKSKLNKGEEEELRSWEGTVNKIFGSDKDNILLEFTATANLSHPAIAEKYEDKLIYEYSLKQFRMDGYSKEVNLLQSDFKDSFGRALAALVVSQYRRKVAEKARIHLKPVVLFKSKTIKESEEFKEEFHNKIKSLKVADISKLEKASFLPAPSARQTGEGDTALDDAFGYFKREKITLNDLKKEIQEEFSEEKCIAVNSKDESEEKQILVNSLEDENNEIRAIFAVDKLNEGWDVLNLFDIVRMYETRDSKSNRPGKTTVQEAQLIGRGARYFPFKLEEEQDKYKRKYDDEADNELRILEELHYHSLNNSRYIQEIKTALKDSGIMPKGDVIEVELAVKDKIKKTDFWKEGVVFLNKKEKFDRGSIERLSDVIGEQAFKVRVHGGGVQEESAFVENEESRVRELARQKMKLSKFGENVIRSAMDRVEGFDFHSLKEIFPNLESVRNFIVSEDYLAFVEVELEGEAEELYSLNQREKLEVAIEVLEEIIGKMRDNIFEYEGTTKFYPVPVKDRVKNKTLSIARGDEEERGLGMKDPSSRYRLDLSKKDWYVFEENYGTSEEKSFVKFVDNAMKDLEKKYDEVVLLRNERMFQIYRFQDGKPLEPDFVLFLKEKVKNKSLTYQLFVEPKGAHLRKTDEWKEDLLKEIADSYELEKSGLKTLFEDADFKLVGMPFYTEDQNTEFEERWEDIVGLSRK